jgi:hypothetical protein
MIRGGALCAAVLLNARGARAQEPAPSEDAAPPALPKAPPPKEELDAARRSSAPAETVVAKPTLSDDHWTFFTNGRVGTFLNWSKGDGLPQATTYDLTTDQPKHAVLTNTGGSGTGNQTSRPATKTDGTPSPVALVNTIDSMRVRSGFVGNQLVLGARRRLGNNTVTVLADVRVIVDSQAEKKYFQTLPDVRQGYFKIEGSWGSFLAGRSEVLFNHGGVETDYLYLHGYGLGFPGDLNSSGNFPTAGQIGYGILANGYAAGFAYGTPSLAGVQLWVGLYDPASLTGSSIERTKFLRPEFELTIDEAIGTLGKVHVYANGGWQPNYQQNKTDDVSKAFYGAGYGARLELGIVHLAGGGHWGRGLGFTYPGLPSDAVYDNESVLRYSDGYFGMLQVVLGKFDLNGGYGQSRIKLTTFDRTAVLNPATNMIGDPAFSVIKSQAGISAAVVFHAQDWLHFDLDFMNADAQWSLGERQKINYVNAGTTVTW